MRGGRGIEALRRAVKLRGRQGRVRDEIEVQHKGGEKPRRSGADKSGELDRLQFSRDG